MKKFLIKILIFAAVAGIIDVGFGYLCSYLNSHAKGGDTYNHFHIAKEMSDSVLIFGSSRAIHHYNPQILEDSLNTTVYNCGVDGNGIIYNYGRLLTILNRYKPRTIIYDVIPAFDMEEDDCTKYLQWQKRWYDVPGIPEIFHDVDPVENIKMLSNLYRYNSSFIQMFSDNVRPLQSVAYKGYKPLAGKINYNVEKEDLKPAQWSELKLDYFTKFVNCCKENNIKLVISLSPWYKAANSNIFSNLLMFAEDNNLEIINMLSEPDISFNPKYFEDAAHLNSEGADYFSRKFATRLLRQNVSAGNR